MEQKSLPVPAGGGKFIFKKENIGLPTLAGRLSMSPFAKATGDNLRQH
jgi:hypothetical protein